MENTEDIKWKLSQAKLPSTRRKNFWHQGMLAWLQGRTLSKLLYGLSKLYQNFVKTISMDHESKIGMIIKRVKGIIKVSHNYILEKND